MINLQDNEIMLRCSCYSREHIAFLIHDHDDTRGNNLKGENDDWYLSVSLDQHTFWRRIGKAFQYVFAPRRLRYGMYAELVLRSEDIDRVAAFITSRRSVGGSA